MEKDETVQKENARFSARHWEEASWESCPTAHKGRFLWRKNDSKNGAQSPEGRPGGPQRGTTLKELHSRSLIFSEFDVDGEILDYWADAVNVMNLGGFGREGVMHVVMFMAKRERNVVD